MEVRSKIMSETIKFKRTSVLQKRPTAAQLDLGEPAVVLHQSSFGVFLEDANGDIRKLAQFTLEAALLMERCWQLRACSWRRMA